MAKRKVKAKAPEFVLDCSLTVAWFFEDEADVYAQAVEDSLPAAAAIVPALWPLEVANALVMGERRKRATEAKVTTFLRLLKALPIVLDDETAGRAWQESIQLARAHQLSVYDAAYLELALRRDLPLATLDDRLKAAAQTVGVFAYVP
ncbi:MAG TPA: type II toxin-antitoxin system VapC family toxin [Pirellulales bacterium]|jgi:predicted nucleic acid-binding protein|nr:type II toxin-antitoxin system VapC family toxin [Pirellulales bacterium]